MLGLANRIARWQLSRRMSRDWDDRARENARHYVDTGRTDWTDEDFFASGKLAIDQDILSDTENIYQGMDPADMKVVEIGCGAGRLTRALSDLFGEVHAVDVSQQMVEEARKALADRPNAHVHHNNGYDLSMLPSGEFDFGYSAVVFQHIPSAEVIENYVREVHRLLNPGKLFKFQVQGYTKDNRVSSRDTWHGVGFDEDAARAMAERCGFEMRYTYGAGNQYFWLWYFKRP